MMIASGQNTSEPIWSPKISYNTIVKEAQQGSPYHQGVVGIYLRSGEAGCAVNLKLAGTGQKLPGQKVTPLELTILLILQF